VLDIAPLYGTSCYTTTISSFNVSLYSNIHTITFTMQIP